MADLAATFDDLVRVETVLWNAIDERLRREHDLTLARFETMQIIDGTAGCRVMDIAEQLAIGRAGASKIVDRVDSAGHCRRRPNPEDARSALITLTPQGAALLRKATISFRAELHLRLAAALTPVQLDDLGRSLSRLRAASTASTRGLRAATATVP